MYPVVYECVCGASSPVAGLTVIGDPGAPAIVAGQAHCQAVAEATAVVQLVPVVPSEPGVSVTLNA